LTLREKKVKIENKENKFKFNQEKFKRMNNELTFDRILLSQTLAQLPP